MRGNFNSVEKICYHLSTFCVQRRGRLDSTYNSAAGHACHDIAPHHAGNTYLMKARDKLHRGFTGATYDAVITLGMWSLQWGELY